jgi:hypothetical protein
MITASDLQTNLSIKRWQCFITGMVNKPATSDVKYSIIREQF